MHRPWQNWVDREAVSLLAVMGLALAPRLIGVGWDLPQVYHPDEPFYIERVLIMMQTGDLNPHWFQYPPLFLYLLVPAGISTFLVGAARGAFAQVADMTAASMATLGTGTTEVPMLYLLGRLMMTICGLVTVYLVYRLGRELFGHRTGITAALFLALSPTHVLSSHYYRPDALVALFATAAVYAAVGVYRRGRWTDYLAAGVLAGLAASSKYNGGTVLLTLWVAHVMRRGALTDARLWLGTLASGAGFLAGAPSALLDMPAWLDGMALEVRHYNVFGHPGAEGGNGALWYLGKLLASTGVVPLLATLGVVADAVRKRWSTILIASFVAVYFALIASPRVHATIALTPLLPLLAVPAARGFAVLWEWMPMRGRRLALARVALLVVLLAVPTVQTARTAYQFARPEVRTLAERWMVDHLPASSRVAAESYSPLLTDHFDTTYVARLTDHPPEWYLENDFDYVVASSAMYGRFFIDAGSYEPEVAAYEEIFTSFSLLTEVAGPFKFLAEPAGVVRLYVVGQLEREPQAGK